MSERKQEIFIMFLGAAMAGGKDPTAAAVMAERAIAEIERRFPNAFKTWDERNPAGPTG